MKLFQRAGHLAVYLAVRTAVCVVQAMRLETCVRLVRPLSWLLADVLKLRQQVVLDNLRIAFPEWSDRRRLIVARRMWQHLLLFGIESIHLTRKVHETNWRRFLKIRRKPEMVRLLLDERPLVMVTGHFGNFEYGGYAMGVLGFPTYTVARRLDNPYLDRFVNTFRSKTGQHIIAKDDYDGILEVLRRDETLILLGDQYAGRKGCWVDFFGREASTHKAIALLSLNHDAPLAVASTGRPDDKPLRCEMALVDVVDPRDGRPETANVRSATQWYIERLEHVIRSAPHQYWWLHNRWKAKRQRKARRRAAA